MDWVAILSTDFLPYVFYSIILQFIGSNIDYYWQRQYWGVDIKAH